MKDINNKNYNNIKKGFNYEICTNDVELRKNIEKVYKDLEEKEKKKIKIYTTQENLLLPKKIRKLFTRKYVTIISEDGKEETFELENTNEFRLKKEDFYNKLYKNSLIVVAAIGIALYLNKLLF